MQNNQIIESLAKELPALSTQSTRPTGINIITGFKALSAIEDSIREQISEVSKELRRPVLVMYKTAFFLAYRGIIDLIDQMEKGGEL